MERRDIVFDLGVGARLEPSFPSSDRYDFRPWPIVDLRFLRLPVVGEVVTGRKRAVSLYPSFDFVGAREQADAAYLAGTDDTDFAFEIGPGIALEAGFVRAFVEARYGVTGHSGVVGEAGFDFIARQHERFEVSVGPRIGAATDDYMDTYFGVGPGAAVLAPYDPDPGVKDVGVEVNAVLALTPSVRLHGRAGYKRFVGEAADSPIVRAGEDDAFSVGIGISYRFGADLF